MTTQQQRQIERRELYLRQTGKYLQMAYEGLRNPLIVIEGNRNRHPSYTPMTELTVLCASDPTTGDDDSAADSPRISKRKLFRVRKQERA